LEKLNVGGNAGSTAARIQAIAGLLEREASKLSSLDLSMQRPGLGASPLALALTTNTTLKKLHLGNLKDEGLFALATGLQSNQTLETLTLVECGINNSKLASLCAPLPNWSGLKKLNLRWNGFNESGIDHILEALKENMSLTELGVDHKNENGKTQKLMEYYLRLNQGGRRVLHTSLRPSLWPLILEKSKDVPDVLYHFLMEEIIWIRL
jgi:Ran GTPase-activating protein (RanGAP) involved in mRNA processing and transport